MENKNCYVCGKDSLSKNEIGLNKKMLGRSIERFHCIDCLALYFEITVEELTGKIEEFKNQGCTLFE